MYPRVNGSPHCIGRMNGDVNVHVNPYDPYSMISGNISSPYSSLAASGAAAGGAGGVVDSGASGLYGNAARPSVTAATLAANNRLHFSNSSRNSVNVTNNTCNGSNSNLLHHQTSLSLSQSAVTSSAAAAASAADGTAVTANIAPLAANISSSSTSNITPIGNVISSASARLLDANFTQSSSSQLISNATNNLLSARNHQPQPQPQPQQLHHASSVLFTSNSLGNTHVLPNSSLDVNASSPSSDTPQKKTFYLLIVLIAIGITIMLLTVVTAIVIFFKCKSFSFPLPLHPPFSRLM